MPGLAPRGGWCRQQGSKSAVSASQQSAEVEEVSSQQSAVSARRRRQSRSRSQSQSQSHAGRQSHRSGRQKAKAGLDWTGLDWTGSKVLLLAGWLSHNSSTAAAAAATTTHATTHGVTGELSRFAKVGLSPSPSDQGSQGPAANCTCWPVGLSSSSADQGAQGPAATTCSSVGLASSDQGSQGPAGLQSILLASQSIIIIIRPRDLPACPQQRKLLLLLQR